MQVVRRANVDDMNVGAFQESAGVACAFTAPLRYERLQASWIEIRGRDEPRVGDFRQSAGMKIGDETAADDAETDVHEDT